MAFALGDYLAGMLIGCVTALAVRAVVWPGMDMVLGMLLGTLIGVAIHIALGLLLVPLLGMFQSMVPGMTIGMYGGMLFGMRDAMSAGSRTGFAAALVGSAFGACVVLAIRSYDRVLRGAVVDSGD